MDESNTLPVLDIAGRLGRVHKAHGYFQQGLQSKLRETTMFGPTER